MQKQLPEVILIHQRAEVTHLMSQFKEAHESSRSDKMEETLRVMIEQLAAIRVSQGNPRTKQCFKVANQVT